MVCPVYQFVNASTLAGWLDAGEPVTVLDARGARLLFHVYVYLLQSCSISFLLVSISCVFFLFLFAIFFCFHPLVLCLLLHLLRHAAQTRAHVHVQNNVRCAPLGRAQMGSARTSQLPSTRHGKASPPGPAQTWCVSPLARDPCRPQVATLAQLLMHSNCNLERVSSLRGPGGGFCRTRRCCRRRTSRRDCAPSACGQTGRCVHCAYHSPGTGQLVPPAQESPIAVISSVVLILHCTGTLHRIGCGSASRQLCSGRCGVVE